MNAANKIISAATFGFAAVSEDGSLTFDMDVDWVRATADATRKPYRMVKVAPSVATDWMEGDFSRPVEVGEIIHYAGESITTAILAGRDEAIAKVIGPVHPAVRVAQ